MKILLLADIHGNYPALAALSNLFADESFQYIINCGDSLVYAPFANETMRWLEEHQALSILGNTDKKVIRLLQGKPMRKPSKEEKRVMYTSTARQLEAGAAKYLLSLPTSATVRVSLAGPESGDEVSTIGIFHGSPEEPHEFLFDDTPDERFQELTSHCDCQIVVTGHSHTPYHKYIAGTHFINPGSAGRMFDNNPRGSCAVVELTAGSIKVEHFRFAYDVEAVAQALAEAGLPEIYARMFREGRKLN